MAFNSLRKRILALVATAAVASVALSGCAATETASESDFGKLDVQFSWIKNAEFAGEYFADSKGYYTEAGFSSVNLIAGPAATYVIVTVAVTSSPKPFAAT